MNYVIAFIAGGWLIPAVYFAGHVYLADRDADDHPSVAESIMTAISYGLMWPFARQQCIPADEVQ